MIAHWLKSVLTGVLFGCLFMVLNLPFAKAQEDATATQGQVLVIGTGDIQDENVSRARNTAISEALVKGVEEYLTRRLGSQTIIAHFPRLLENVIPTARQWVANYHILAEERMGSRYKILVSVKVDDTLMEERLRDIGIDLVDRPLISVLFLVSQIEPSQGTLSYWWQEPEAGFFLTPVELALYRAFEAQGFQPVNRLLKIPEREYSPEMKAMDLSDEDAIGWGRLFSADTVIRGRCEILEGREVSLMLEAICVEDGDVIHWDIQSEEIKEGPEDRDMGIEAVEAAVNSLAGRLSPKIIDAIKFQEPSLIQLELAVQGVQSFTQFRAFRDFLENSVSGVKSVKQTRIRNDAMFISVEFLGDENRLFAMISKQTSLPFTTDVVETEDGEIIVVIR